MFALLNKYIQINNILTGESLVTFQIVQSSFQKRNFDNDRKLYE